MSKHLQHILFFCLFSVVIDGCTASKIPPASINQIESILFFLPVTQIATVCKGNEGTYDSTISQQSKENLINGVKEYFPKRIKIILLEFDSAKQKDIDSEILSFFRKLKTKKRKDTIIFPQLLDSIMIERKMQYALCLFQNGYIRTEENYDKQLLKAIGMQSALTLFSLGVLIYTNSTVFLVNNSFNKTDSFFSGCILDSKLKSVSFWAKSPLHGGNPIDKKFTDSQIRTTFNDYVYKEQMYYKYGH